MSGRITVLNRAWQSLNKANRDSAGLQGPTIAQFEQGRLGNLRALAADLRTGTFTFSPVKGVAALKSPGKYRPLRVQEIRDRIVCKAIVSLIGRSVTDALNLNHPSSFGYQAGRGTRDALHAMLAEHQKGCGWVFEADIKAFFDSINRDRLLDELIFPALPDDSLQSLIRQALAQQVGNIDDLPVPIQELFQDAGVAQGNALSPLFANAYLAKLDAAMEAGGHRLIRYADDFIVMCRTQEEAQEAEGIAREVLESLNLELHPEKSRRGRVSEGIEFLGCFFNGQRLVPSKKKQARFKARISELTEIAASRPQTLLAVLADCRQFINGWTAAFAHSDILHIEHDLEEHVNARLGIAISKLGWRIARAEVLSAELRLRSGVPTLGATAAQRRHRWPAKHQLFEKYWTPST